MSFNTAKEIELADKQGAIFNGGIVDNLEPNKLANKNTPYGRNFRITGQGISIRPGYYQIGADMGAIGTHPLGIGGYLRTNGNKEIIIRYNIDSTHKLVSMSTTGTFTNIATAALIASDNRMNFVRVNDVMYCMNGSDLLGKLSGTTYSNPTTGVASFTPRFGLYFQKALWVAGVSGSENKVFRSQTNVPDSFTGGDSETLTFPETVTGLTGNNKTTYIFCPTSVQFVSADTTQSVGGLPYYLTMPLEMNEGAVNNETIVSAGKYVYYLSKSNKIREISLSGVGAYDMVELTHRRYRGISTLMNSLDPDQSTAFAYYEPATSLIKWHLKTKGSLVNDIVIIYNQELDEWIVDTNKIFYDGINFEYVNYTVSQIEPKVYIDESGTTDDDSPIQFEYRSKVIDLGQPTYLKELWQTRTYIGINKVCSLVQEIYADGGLVDTKTIDGSLIPSVINGMGTQSIGTFSIGEEGQPDDSLFNISIIRDKGYLQVRAKNYQIKWSCGTLGAKALIQSFTPRMQLLDQLTANNN